MPSAAEIRAGLAAAKDKREEATREMQQWLKAAQGHPDISMGEAARLAGFKSRQGAYELLWRETES